MIAGIPEAELEVAKATTRLIKAAAFDRLRAFTRSDLKPEIAGYKDLADAALQIVEAAAKECEKVMVSLEKKYPPT